MEEMNKSNELITYLSSDWPLRVFMPFMLSKSFTVVIQLLSTRLIKPNFYFQIGQHVVLLQIKIMHRGKPRPLLSFFATKYIDFTCSAFKIVWFCNIGRKKATKIKTTTKQTTKNQKTSYNQSMDLLLDNWLKLTFKFTKAHGLYKLNHFSIMSVVDMYPYWISQSNLLLQWQWSFRLLVMVFAYFNS